jgi:hypothetical protein
VTGGFWHGLVIGKSMLAYRATFGPPIDAPKGEW